MASPSPEAKSKKRRDSISHLKRDQPLFASRRFAPSQQAPDFFTESLNTSYAPSPSPARSPLKRQNGRLNQRPVNGSGRPPAAAFIGTSGTNDENRRPTSSPSTDRYRSQYDLKPRPGQSTTRPRTSSANFTPGKNERDKTPSPARGRSLSIVSPVSSQHSQSSPPRGLAESYQRIVDEESLAQEESVDDQMDAYGYDFTEETDVSGLHDPASPTSLKASRKASREATPVGDYPENKENKQRGSESGSQRSSLENVTDRSLDSAISQYSKDAQRLDGALRSNVKIFSKARLGEKVGLTVENLRRRNGSAESVGSTFGGSLSSRGSDPSLNLPKAWGRKAKPPKDWLSRINSKSGRLTGDVPKKQKADSPIIAESEKREWEEPIDSWIQTAADIPLPSEENGSPQVARSSATSTPTTAQNTLRDGASGWDIDPDFTGRSLQVSDSPPIRIRDSTLNGTRSREIVRLEKRAVTTSRLDELRDKTSQERSQRDRPHDEGAATPQSQGLSSRRPSLNPRREKSDLNGPLQTSVDGEGEPIPDTPVVVYRNSSEPSKSRKSARTNDDISPQRPQHERHDSRDILQRLARATSASPASSREGPKPEQSQAIIQSKNKDVGPDEGERDQPFETELGDSEPINDHSESLQRASKTISRKVEDETPRSHKSTTRLATPRIIGSWTDNSISEDTPRSTMPNEYLKTPLVTGAWVDTPLPAGGRGPPMPTPNVEDDRDFILEGNEVRKLATSDLIKKLSPKSDNLPALRNTSRPLPKSALESVLNAAKASLASSAPSPHFASNSDSEDDPPLHLGESTIQSLEDIFADDTSFSSPPSPPPSDPDADNDEDDSPTTELNPYTRQLSRLSSLLPSIRSARKHIAQLERAVAGSSSNSTALTASNPPTQQPECTEAGEFHDFIWPCERCGCSAGGPRPSSNTRMPSLLTFNFVQDMTTLEIPVPRLWRWHQDDWRPRLTWLGLILLGGWSWWVAEGVMCDIYCHPLYAWTMEGYGVDINSPEPPFVLEQMLWRWLSLEGILRPLYVLLRALVRFGAQVVGYVVGISMGEGSGGGGGRQPVATDPRIPRPMYAPDLSMFDDEYL